MTTTDDDGAGVDIVIASIYGARTKQGLVELTIDGRRIVIDLDKAREIRGMLSDAIEAAISDQWLMEFLQQRAGLAEDQAGRALLDFREMRQGTRGTARPS